MENIDFGLLEAVLVLSGIAAGFLVNSFGLGDRIWNKGADHQRNRDMLERLIDKVDKFENEFKEIHNKLGDLQKELNQQI